MKVQKMLIAKICRQLGVKSMIILLVSIVVFICGCILIHIAVITPKAIVCSPGMQEIMFNGNIKRTEILRVDNDSLSIPEKDFLDDRQPEQAVYELIKSHKIVDYDHNLSTKPCPNPPIIVLAINSAANHVDRRHGIRQTWGNGKEFKIRFEYKELWKAVFIVARSGDTAIDKRVNEEAKVYGDLLIIDMKDHHQLLTDKTLLGMHWAIVECKARFYYKGDDDVWVNKWKLLDYVISLSFNPSWDPSNTWMGYISKKNREPVRDKSSKYYISIDDYPGKQFPKYCSGFSYLMTKETATKMISAIPHIKKTPGIDDVYMGLLANYTSIHPIYDGRFHFRVYEKQRVYTPAMLHNYISEHGIKNSKLMQKLNDMARYKYISTHLKKDV